MRAGGSLAGVLALLAALLLAPSASATYDAIGSGTTTIKLDKSFVKILKANHVRLKALKPAKVKGASISLPVSSGKLDPTTTKGTAYLGGGFAFAAGSKSVAVKKAILKTTQKRAPLSAKVAGGQLKLATTRSLKLSRKGFGFRVEAKKLVLASKLAQRLEKRLNLKGELEGDVTLGKVISETQPATTAVLPANSISFAPDPGTFAKLSANFVATNPIFPAEHAGSGFSFPIAGGTIAPTGLGGDVRGSGSLEMIQLPGASQIFLREVAIDLSASAVTAEMEVLPSPPYAGKTGRIAIAALNLAAARVGSDPTSRVVAVEGAPSTLEPALAAAMNQAFAKGKEEFKAGDPFGVFSFAAQGQ